MAGGKQTPRQAMIGMMYLVLLAMLAMNASKDLLNAFVFLENGIGITTDNFDSGNEGIYNKIDEAAALRSKTAIAIKGKADSIKLKSKQLFDKIEALKTEIVQAAGGVDPETGIPIAKDDQDIGAEYFLTYGKGKELKDALADYKNFLNSCIAKEDTSLKTGVNNLLDTPSDNDDNGLEIPWENVMSEYLPLAAVTANLSNVQSYVKNAEAQVIKYMYEEISADTYKVNKILATTIAQNSYVLQGDEYKANVFLAAADTTQEPIILVGEYDTALYHQSGKLNFLGKVDSLPVNGGVGSFNMATSDVGVHEWGGIMKVPHPNPRRKGEFLTYPFQSSYTVAAPSAVISSKDLNIMYKGYGNKLDVSAPGMASDKIDVTAANCTVRKIANGEYLITPIRGKKTKVIVSAKLADGKTQIMGTQDWSIKNFPRPLLFIGEDERPEKLKARKIFSTGGVKVKYSDDFPFNVQPKVTKMKYEVWSKSGDAGIERMVSSARYKTNDRLAFKNLRKGDKLYLYVWAKGPDGREIKLPLHVVKIKR